MCPVSFPLSAQRTGKASEQRGLGDIRPFQRTSEGPVRHAQAQADIPPPSFPAARCTSRCSEVREQAGWLLRHQALPQAVLHEASHCQTMLVPKHPSPTPLGCRTSLLGLYPGPKNNQHLLITWLRNAAFYSRKCGFSQAENINERIIRINVYES